MRAMFTTRIGLNAFITKKVVSKDFYNKLILRQNLFTDKMADRESPPKQAKRELKFERLSANAYPPTRGSKYAAGYDLYAAYDYVIPAMGREMIKTDISIAIPKGCYGRVAPRSGLAWKHFIDVGAGVIDEDYRGNVCVVLFNFNNVSFAVKRGDRIAQLICELIADTELVETKLDETQRSDGGFGSTGVALNNK